MSPPVADSFTVAADEAGRTVAALMRSHLSGQSWSAVRRLLETRRVRVGGELCFDPARRLRAGDVVELLAVPAPKPRRHDAVQIRYLDEHLVVAEKPSGISTVRHPSERTWPARRKHLHPTLEDLLPPLIAAREGRARKGPLPRLRVVQRLDKETSGLVVFARSVVAERELGKQFKRHTVIRRYLAVVPGLVTAPTIRSRLVRDRGDGRRGSTSLPGVGKEAITHIDVAERLKEYSLLACRLETGRTHQIRIHLSESGHAVCGEKVYNRKTAAEPEPDRSGAPRLALHAAELGFKHPVTGADLHWEMPLPADLQRFLDRLKSEPQMDADERRQDKKKIHRQSYRMEAEQPPEH